MLTLGKTAKEVAEHFGCSVASLQVWKKDDKYKVSTDDDGDDEQEEQTPTQHRFTPCQKSEPEISRSEFIKQYWRNRSVESVMETPNTIDERVELINSVLKYAYDRLTG